MSSESTILDGDSFGPDDLPAPSIPSCRCGAGPSAAHKDRCANGHVLKGNTAAILVGAESVTFWRAEQAARDEITQDILADRGTTPSEAPRAMVLVADTIAQAKILRDSAYKRIVETGGPLASDGRARRAFEVWCAAADRLEKHLRLVGLERKARPAPTIAEFIEQQARAARGEEPEQ
jgi:hypothetical protein